MSTHQSPGASGPLEICRLYKYLRVVDVCDAMDGIGYFNIGLMSPEIRPIWAGMKFWGPAFTVRCVPANRPMWRLETTEEIVKAHDAWYTRAQKTSDDRILEMVEPGSVIVTDTGGAGEVGLWGSANSMGAVFLGAAGIVTDGYCRDTAEVALQKTPVCARHRGRTIIPGRIEIVEMQTVIGCGGVQVRPGDIVGCDDDGVVVVPLEVAREVAVHAREILLTDMRVRRQVYEAMKKTPDSTVDHETVAAYYAQFE
jgi:4-hydroxy-4-methyl-2-oxoglutarate aldolase